MPGQGSEGSSGAGRPAAETASSLGQKAQNVASNVAHTAQNVASNVADKAGDALSAVGSGMSSLGSTIRQRAPQGGVLGTAASSVAGGLENTGRYLQQHDLGDMMGDLSSLVRRHPLQALLVGFGVGFLLARATSRG
jgi:ElaB/YqjD/DUF883 family membrane-anchored ribosome-binding protein